MLVTGEVYHIFNKSIAGFKIFNNQPDFSRIVEVTRDILIPFGKSPGFNPGMNGDFFKSGGSPEL